MPAGMHQVPGISLSNMGNLNQMVMNQYTSSIPGINST